MTERFLETLQENTDNTKSSQAYADVWRSLKRAGLEVEISFDDSRFPRLKETRGRAYIPSRALTRAFTFSDSRLNNIFDEHREKNSRNTFGGMTNEALISALNAQFQQNAHTIKSQLEIIKGLPKRLLVGISTAVIAQSIDYSQSTPEIAQGHVKDVIAVPLFSYIAPITTDYRKNTAIFTGFLMGWEFAQKFKPFSSTWTYDPQDFVAYGIGTVAYVGVQEAKKRIGRKEAKNLHPPTS